MNIPCFFSNDIQIEVFSKFFQFEFLNISFWYIPKSLRGQEETPEWWDKLSKVMTLLAFFWVVTPTDMRPVHYPVT